MATYKHYSASEYGSVAAVARQYLSELGLFDSVSIDNGIVSCTYGGSVIATFEWTNGGVDVTFGAYTFHAGDCTDFWIGRAQNGVVFSHKNAFISGPTYYLYTIFICRTQAGAPMLGFHELGQMSSGTDYITTYDNQSTTVGTTTPGLRSENDYYSNLVGINTINTADEIVATASKAFCYADRQNNVPKNSMSVVNIAGTNYLTDGYIAVSDS